MPRLLETDEGHTDVRLPCVLCRQTRYRDVKARYRQTFEVVKTSLTTSPPHFPFSFSQQRRQVSGRESGGKDYLKKNNKGLEVADQKKNRVDLV